MAAHLYGLSAGGTDLAVSSEGAPSAGFWTAMGDYWTGYPLGFQPPAMDPWHLDNWGWLSPLVITNTTRVYTVTLGQASRFTDTTAPGPDQVYRGVKIALPPGHAPLPAPLWEGKHYWWGGSQDLADATMTSRQAVTIPANGATLSFETAYAIESGYDFMWVQVSIDCNSWSTLKNADTTCAHWASWLGGQKGMEQQCGSAARAPHSLIRTPRALI